MSRLRISQLLGILCILFACYFLTSTNKNRSETQTTDTDATDTETIAADAAWVPVAYVNTYVGPPFQPEIPESKQIVDSRCAVLVVTVRGSSRHTATRQKPPIIELKIEQSLFGKPQPQNRLKCLWALPYDPDYVYNQCGNGPQRQLSPKEKQRRKKIAAEPVSSPKVGSRWIILFSGPLAPPNTKWKSVAKYKYPYSKKKYDWAVSELKKREQFQKERSELVEKWPAGAVFPLSLLQKECRPIEMKTTLKKGTLVIEKKSLITLNPAWHISPRGFNGFHVVKLLKDGRVQIRPLSFDSRSDQIVKRDKLSLLPKKWVTVPKMLSTRYSEKQLREFAAMADHVVVASCFSWGLSKDSSSHEYAFQCQKTLKGKHLYSVKIRIPRKSDFHFYPFNIPNTEDKRKLYHYILFLKKAPPRAMNDRDYAVFHPCIAKGGGVVESDEKTLKIVKAGIK